MGVADKGSAWQSHRANFDRNLAVVIGIDRYEHDSIRNLSTAVGDAKAIADLLERDYGYQSGKSPGWLSGQSPGQTSAVIRLFDAAATRKGLQTLFDEILPKHQLSEGDRLIVYFAGHGLPRSNDDGPEGYLVPYDADPTEPASFLAMGDIADALSKLHCHHLLVILDCCFAGTFRWAGSRKAVPILETLRREHYYHFIRHPAWQVITSSAHDQEALDVARLQEDNRQPVSHQRHSPFALALLEGLQLGDQPQRVKADLFPDGVVTAHELFVYLQNRVKALSGNQQAPGIYPLRRDYDKGEFVFTPPTFDPHDLAEALPLNHANNPYRGLQSFDECHAAFFFGRQALVDELAAHLDQPDRVLTVVLGVSGSGKSSLVKAGLIPCLRRQKTADNTDRWHILDPLRPDGSLVQSLAKALGGDFADQPQDATGQTLEPASRLSAAIATWSQKHPGTRLLLVIDQLEELLTRQDDAAQQIPDENRESPNTAEPKEWHQVLATLTHALEQNPHTLRLVVTLRSDFEPRFLTSPWAPYWQAARFPVRAMTSDELREAIEHPALKQALYFEPPELVGTLIDEVGQMPGALPLLSFTLSELYIKLYQRWQHDQSTDRTLRLADYQALGGVTGALIHRATEEYHALNKNQQATLRRVMLRMIALEAGGIARRQVPKAELVYGDPEENQRIQTVIQRFSAARLIVEGANSQGAAYVEPAHDALIQGWDQLLAWKREEEDTIVLQRRLTPAAEEWKTVKINERPPTLPLPLEPLINGLDRGFYTIEHGVEQLVTRLIQARQRQRRSKETSNQFLWDANPYLEVLTQVLNASHHWFNQIESEFVRQSALQKRRTVSWRWRIAIAVMLGLSGLTIAALIGQRNALISQVQASQRSAEANFRAGQSLNAFLDSLRSARTLQQPLLQAVKPDPQLTQQIQGLLQKAIYSVQEQNRLTEHSGITRSTTSPDGQLIATVGENGIVALWNWQGQKQAQWDTGQGRIMNLSFSPDSKQLATAGGVTVRLWNVQGKPLAVFKGHTDMVKGLSFSPDGQRLATAGRDKTIRLWTLQGKPLAVMQGHEKDVWSVVFSPDGQRLASASDDDTVRLWTLQGRELQQFQAQQSELHTLQFSPDGQRLATAGQDGRIRLWTAQGKPLAILLGHQGRVWNVTFSKDGHRLASASADGTVRLWNLQGQPLATQAMVILLGHRGPVRQVSFSPDGHRLVSSGDDSTVRLWTLHGQQQATLLGHQGAVRALQFSADGQRLATSGDDQTIRLWTLQGQQVGLFQGNLGVVRAIVLSPDGQPIASAQGQILRLWTQPDRPAIDLKGHQGLVRSITLSPDGQRLASAGDDGAIHLWDRQGRFLATWNADKERVWAVRFSPDGQQLASAGDDGVVRLWSLQGKEVKKFEGHLGPVYSVEISLDGQQLASAGQDGTIRLWDLRHDRKLTLFQVYDAEINSVAFSPDGQFLTSGDSLGHVQLWNLHSQQQVADWNAHPGSIVRSVKVSPNGKLLATAADDGTAKVWQLEQFDALFTKGCALMNDYLTYLKQAQKQTGINDDRTLCDGR